LYKKLIYFREPVAAFQNAIFVYKKSLAWCLAIDTYSTLCKKFSYTSQFLSTLNDFEHMFKVTVTLNEYLFVDAVYF